MDERNHKTRRDTGQGKLRSEELWMLKVEGCSCQKERTIINRGDRKHTKSIYDCGRETMSGMGCINQGLGVSMKGFEAMRRSEGIAGWWQGKLEMVSGKTVRCECDVGDRVSDVRKVNV